MVVGGRELIDTLWNVNDTIVKRIASGDVRINRYIMECKYNSESDMNVVYIELIDTLWNVNSKLTCHSSSPFFELIDTLWNVNYLPSVSNFEPIAELIDTLWNVNSLERKDRGDRLRN